MEIELVELIFKKNNAILQFRKMIGFIEIIFLVI